MNQPLARTAFMQMKLKIPTDSLISMPYGKPLMLATLLLIPVRVSSGWVILNQLGLLRHPLAL